MRLHRRPGLAFVGPAVPDTGTSRVRHSRTYGGHLRHRRPGLSLTEVLVAMFVMALGLMALLTLFPLGAIQIGQALKDDRTAQTAAQADTWVRVWWRDAVAPYQGNPNGLPGDAALLALTDPNVADGAPSGGNKVYAAPFVGASLALLPYSASGTNPRLGNPATPSEPFVVFTPQTSLEGTAVVTAAGTQSRVVSTSPGGVTAPGYPVLLDPLGYLATRGTGTTGLDRFWVGRNNGTVYGQPANTVPLLLPRRSTGFLQTVGQQAQAYAACALTDDLTFQANGGTGQPTTDPDTNSTVANPLGRQGRYHWAALLQRPNNSTPDQANLTVLVFDGRPPFLGIQGDEVVLTNGGGGVFVNGGGMVTAGDRSLTLNVPTRGADQGPLIRRGGWVMIVSLTSGVRSVGFHRVTGLTTGDDTAVGSVAVTPVSLDIDPPAKATIPAGEVQVYLLAGLSEVFERPLLTR